MKDMIKKHIDVIIAFVIPILFFSAIYVVGETIKQRNKESVVVETSQSLAESPEAIMDISHSQGACLGLEQAVEVAEDISYIYSHDVEPAEVITTNGYEAEKVVKAKVKENKADITIVTDKADKDKVVSLSSIPSESKVELNQYNIRAYKQELNTIEYSPFDKQVEYSHSWKVTDNGNYLGVGIKYDYDDYKTYLTVSYTW